MLSLKDYNLELIRDFSEDQFSAHIQLIEDVKSENDFGITGIDILLQNYLNLIHIIKEKYQKGQEEFCLTKNEVFLYDLCVEIARLCYKHSYNTSLNNDWEEEFQ